MLSRVMRVACLGALTIASLLVLASAGCGDNDTTPPTITDVEVTDLSETSATITWATDEPCISEIECCSANVTVHGQFVSYPLDDSSYVLSHSYELTRLTANTTYHYQVRSIDKCGNETVSAEYSFATLPS